MTDADRKRAFDICTGDYLACEDDCPYAKHGFSILGCLREHRKYMRDEINRQKAEIFNLNKEISALKLKNNEFLNSNEKAQAEIEKKDTEIEILIRKKEALRDEISELTAEVERKTTECERLEIYMDELVKQKLNQAKTEAYKEFAERLKDVPSIIIAGQKHYVIVETYFDNTLKELTRNLHGTCTESKNQTATNHSVSLIDGHIEG